MIIHSALQRAALTLILLSVTIHPLLASIPGELLGETKLSDVPGQGFGSTMLAVQGDTLVAKTNVYVRIGADWVVQDQLVIMDPVTPSAIPDPPPSILPRKRSWLAPAMVTVAKAPPTCL